MRRSLILVAAFLFFSVVMPCFCVGTESPPSLMDDPCVAAASSGEHEASATGGMKLFDHVASWRAFLSSFLPALFLFVCAALMVVFVSRPWYAPRFRTLESRWTIFHPPEHFDERVLLSKHLFHALYSGVLHAKLA